MIFGKIITAPTSQDQPSYTFCQAGVANPGGGSTAGNVTIAVSFGTTMAYPNGYPVSYVAHITPQQPNCIASIAAKTPQGFNVILSPSPSTATLASGVFDLMVIG